MYSTRRPWIKYFCTWLLLTATGPGMAQGLEPGANPYTLPPGSMPSWTVPVLRLVSATHVEPTTGVVLSDTGLVLIPGDFASMGDEIIVLDGGTDIIRNGRPARIERKFAFEGLQVIAVDGLKRQGVTLASRPLEEGAEIILTAFPPAELIAQGEPPLSVPASVVVFGENGIPSISSETKLPNVSGALVDSCGNLVAYSMAEDVQSMETSPGTRYQWRNTLLQVFREMQVTPREFDCSGQAAQEQQPEPPVEQPPVTEPVVEEPVLEETPAPEAAPEPEPEPIPEPEEVPATEEELPPEILPPIERDTPDLQQDEEEVKSRAWIWLLAAALLFGLGFVLHRLRRKQDDATDTVDENLATADGPVQEGIDEPAPAAPPELDSLLLIRGVLADGTAFEDSCAVSENAINVVIGRTGTDLVVDSGAVSRRHASLNGSRSELTLSDLGSSNGTSINGVPCLEGEIMYVEPGDTLVLGNARCTLEIRPRKSAGDVTA